MTYELISADHFKFNPPCSDTDIERAERQLGRVLPSDFVLFLKKANGGLGFIGPEYLVIWQVQELAFLNTAYEIQQYAPGLLAFGSDGGGNGFAFNCLETPWSVVEFAFIGMDYIEPLGSSFDNFISELLRDGRV